MDGAPLQQDGVDKGVRGDLRGDGDEGVSVNRSECITMKRDIGEEQGGVRPYVGSERNKSIRFPGNPAWRGRVRLCCPFVFARVK